MSDLLGLRQIAGLTGVISSGNRILGVLDAESPVEEKVQPQPASSSRNSTALTTLPLCASASSTAGPRERMGWALLMLLEPVVE